MIRFDNELRELNEAMTKMGSLCEEAIALSASALISGKKELAQEVEGLEREIDAMENDIESMCLQLLLRRQPVARDLRQISAALKLVTDMERIGDQAADIAEITASLDGHSADDCAHVSEMANAVIQMVNESVDSFVQRDTNLAHEVIEHDDVVDALFEQVKAALIEIIVSDPGFGETALGLLMIAKYLERIGDHAVNIAEWVIFCITGLHHGVDAI